MCKWCSRIGFKTFQCPGGMRVCLPCLYKLTAEVAKAK